jgi:hypothetical protein
MINITETITPIDLLVVVTPTSARRMSRADLALGRTAQG